jgi:hypothetical protein
MLPESPAQRADVVVFVAASKGVVQSQLVDAVFVLPLNDAASLPAVSCTAEFDVELLAVGARYDTSTVVPLGTELASVNRTVFPTTVAAVGVTAVSPTNTVYVVGDAVVVERVSLKVSVTVVPLTATDDSVGGAISGPAVELFVTLWFVNAMASLPEESCIAEFVVNPFGVGAAYETITTWPASTAEPRVS